MRKKTVSVILAMLLAFCSVSVPAAEVLELSEVSEKQNDFNGKEKDLSGSESATGSDTDPVTDSDICGDTDSVNDTATDSDTDSVNDTDTGNDTGVATSSDIAMESDEEASIIIPPPGTVTGFPVMDQADSTIRSGYKPSMEELKQQMPDTFSVYLDYCSEAVEIPVEWVSEVDYETTNETYYIFWANWDQEMYPLVSGYGHEDYLPFVELILDTSSFMSRYVMSSGVTNIVARARQMVDIHWTPVRNVNGFSSSTDQLTVYQAGVTYHGIPYGQQVYSGTWVPNTTDFDTFLSAVSNAASPMYSARGSYGDMNSTYYANDCSSFASYCYGLPRMTTWAFATSSRFSKVSGNSIYNAQVGDCFNSAGAHIEMITGMEYDAAGNLISVEISEQTPPKARTVIYTPKQAQNLINTGYTLLRFDGRNSVAAPESYSSYASDLAMPEKVNYGNEADAEITVKDRNGNATDFDIVVTDLEYYSKTTYKAAIWSNENGQDDLKWIQLSRQTDGSFTATMRLSDFKHKGKFILHLYKVDPFQSICLRTTDFVAGNDRDPAETADVSAESVTVDRINDLTGTCRILVSGVSCPDGVAGLKIPVWTDAKQADIQWYTAKQLDSATWYVNLSAGNHGNSYGPYQIHVYGTNKAGKMNFCGNTKHSFAKVETEVTSKVEGTTVTVSARNLALFGGIKNILIPTWSAENGQDDLRWESAVYNAETGTAEAKINLENYKHFGAFYSHVYAQDNAGKLIYMGKTTYTAEEPDYVPNDISCSYNNSTGDFTVSITRPRTGEGRVTSVMIPIWSGKKQEDIRWYEAVARSGERYVVSGNIKNHLGIGKYNCHVYGKVNGKLVFLGNTDFTASISMKEIILGSSTEGVKYPIQVKGLSSPVALKRIEAAVWSEKGGQDDLVWYTLSGSGAGLQPGVTEDFKGSVDIRKHKTLGTYFVHLYGVTTDGKHVFIQAEKLDVSSAAEAVCAVKDPVAGDGKLQLTIAVKNSNWDIPAVSVPVWSASDQSDIFWYQAVKNSDGSWSVEINKKNHKNHTGTCQIHVYANYSNGIMGYVGHTTAVLS
ncbi:MAG: GBS Bsp-like repeat-containing protein [Lachnospiraceae bacterium]|nr:GBS Bsp-like repeat-containing protein [Lachnospiraceae bacterium]